MFKHKASLKPKRIGRFSLGFKLSLGITLLIMFLMICVGVNSYLRNRAIMLEEAQNRGWITARTVSAFAADYLRGNNTALLSNIMDHLERDPFVKRVAILDLTGNVVMSSDQGLLNQKLDEPKVKEAMGQNKDTLNYRSDLKGRPLAMEFISPVAPRGEAPVGYFWMETDLRYISAHLIETSYNLLYTSLLAILAGLIISRLIILRVVQRPVQELVKATDRVSTGDFSGEVQVFNQDELGRLATAFNTMTGHLGVLFQSIRTSVNDINHTAQVIINRSEQSDIATKKILQSLNSQTDSPEAQDLLGPEVSRMGTEKIAENTRNQQENLKEIRNASKKLIRYIDRLNSISLQFKFHEK
ncbi:MAG: HAMP domain-containing protein [Bacillota bacterium]